MSFYNSFETPVVTLRPFNTYVPRQSARAVIPSIISQFANGNSHIQLGSISPTRDFNFVSDTVGGFLAALKSDKCLGEVINIGSNFEISIGDTVKLIAELMNSNIDLVVDDQRLRPLKSEVERLWASNTKALSLLDWSPQYGGLNGFKKGLLETIKWFIDPINLSKYKSEIYNI